MICLVLSLRETTMTNGPFFADGSLLHFQSVEI